MKGKKERKKKKIGKRLELNMQQKKFAEILEPRIREMGEK